MRTLTLWWAALAAGTLGACAGGWVALILEWNGVATGGDVIPRAAAAGFALMWLIAVFAIHRHPPLDAGPFGDGDMTPVAPFAFCCLVPILAVIITPVPLVVVLAAGVLCTGIATVMFAAMRHLGGGATTTTRSARGMAMSASAPPAGPYDQETEVSGPYDQERDDHGATTPPAGRPVGPRWRSAAAMYDRAQAAAWLHEHDLSMVSPTVADRDDRPGAAGYWAPVGIPHIGGVG